MSGIIGSILTDTLNVANRPAPVILGDMTFLGPEAPSRITVGGTQVHVVHKMPGGARIVDAMGPDESAIAWQGLFIGPAAASRARLLDSMRVQGVPLTLSFGDYLFNVLVVQFQYSYQDRGAVISYKLKAEIVSDPGSGTVIATNAVQSAMADCSFAQQLLTATSATVAAYEPVGNLAAVSSSGPIGAISTQLATSVSLLSGQAKTPDSVSPADTASISAAALQVRGAIQDLSVGPLATGASALTVSQGAELASLTASAGTLAGLVRAGGYLNRASAGLASATASAVSPIIHA